TLQTREPYRLQPRCPGPFHVSLHIIHKQTFRRETSSPRHCLLINPPIRLGKSSFVRKDEVIESSDHWIFRSDLPKMQFIRVRKSHQRVAPPQRSQKILRDQRPGQKDRGPEFAELIEAYAQVERTAQFFDESLRRDLPHFVLRHEPRRPDSL